jgi:putative ABC transport system substrate-binding protein
MRKHHAGRQAHRRQFLLAAGAASLAAAFPVLAQAAPNRVGWIAPSTAANNALFLEALRLGLRDLGYVEGANLVLDARAGDNSTAQVDVQVAELIAARSHVIVALGPTAYAARRLSKDIPVVFGFSGDPVLAGFAQSFARPGGNLTGMSFLAMELVTKRIEMLKAVMPGVKRIAILANSQHPGDQAERRASEAAAAAMGIEIEYFEVSSTAQLDNALAGVEKSRSEAAVMFPITPVITNSARIAAWSVRSRIPAVSGWAVFADEGNLFSYGANLRETFRRLAVYVDKILKGARPEDLPVELPLHIEFVINLKAARALGISVPQPVMLRADRVIE